LDNSLSIRHATPKDMPQIKEIIDLSFPMFFRYFAAHSVSDFTELTLVSQQNADILGFAKLMQFQISTIKYGCILWIAVHPKHRQRGIALTLTNRGTNWLMEQGATAVFASTQRRNQAALATLSKAGFVRCRFGDLWQMFGWRVFELFKGIWLAPREVILVKRG
jgi:ribosomal protein S18 acetylase RimI-like enzyme